MRISKGARYIKRTQKYYITKDKMICTISFNSMSTVLATHTALRTRNSILYVHISVVNYIIISILVIVLDLLSCKLN